MARPYRDLATYDGPSGFVGALGKTLRVKFQLEDLNERFQERTQLHHYGIGEKLKRGPGEEITYLFVVDSEPSLPKREWGVLIGEIVHNLRSALDQAAYAAAERPSRDTQFPIFTRREDWEKKSCAMIYSVPEHVVEFIEDLQPYHAKRPVTPRRHLFAILNSLSNHDKHHLLHTTVLTLEGASPTFRIVRDVEEIRNARIKWGKLEAGAELARLRLVPNGPDPKVAMEGEFAHGVAFSEPTGRNSVIDGGNVIQLLTMINGFVQETVMRMEYITTTGQPWHWRRNP